VAAIDLGFVRDSTALVIVGRDPADAQRLRLVAARAWTPEVGPLGFGPTLDEVADLCLAHGVSRVATDQHHAVAAVEHLGGRGLHATTVATTPASKSQMFSNLKTLLYGGRLELYQHPALLAELRRVETVTTPGAASVRIRRLGSSHGDLATALALACSRLRAPARARPGHVGVPVGQIPHVLDQVRWHVGEDPLRTLADRIGVPARGRPPRRADAAAPSGSSKTRL
jgi:hypothetical protein